MDYEHHLNRIREMSRRYEVSFRGRYASGPAEPLLLAQQWRTALQAEPLDWAKLSAIREEALLLKHDADVAFFTFINALERDYTLLRRAELEST